MVILYTEESSGVNPCLGTAIIVKRQFLSHVNGKSDIINLAFKYYTLQLMSILLSNIVILYTLHFLMNCVQCNIFSSNRILVKYYADTEVSRHL